MPSVHIAGTATSMSWADPSRSLTDLIFECVSTALADAGLRATDLDAVVLAAHDLVDGRGLTNMVTAPAAAAYLKDETRLGEDGATAFLLADARVRAGTARTCLVAAWGRASEGPAAAISHALFDPFFGRPLALTEIAVSGLRASRSLAEHPGYGSARRGAAARRARRPADPERRPAPAWPLRHEELPLWADVVAAAVLTETPTGTRVTGAGLSTEPFELGDRDLLGMPALRAAAAEALRSGHAGAADIGVLELDGLTTFDEALAAEAVGAASAGEGMAFLATSPAVDPGGGSGAGYCAPAMGLVRICRARERLLAGESSLALATGASTVAAQNQAAVLLERVGDA